jgi:hypothetical protein
MAEEIGIRRGFFLGPCLKNAGTGAGAQPSQSGRVIL